MKKTIQKLRKKDNHQKDQIAFIGALIVTTFIVLFWLASFSVKQGVNESQMANTVGPIDSIKETISDIFSSDR